MLPGVGIFGSDPVSKVLIQLLKHFEFEVHAIWTNHLIDTANTTAAISRSAAANKLITTQVDHVLLNKSVQLIFVCCQPNIHAQISSKALGIGKSVICLFPTCKELDQIAHMINSARYYPSLVSSVFYGGVKYLAEFRALKQALSLLGDLKCCQVHITCQNLALARQTLLARSDHSTTSTSGHNHQSNHQRSASISSLIDSINLAAASSQSSTSINWLSDKELGAGCLNRFGAAIVSMILNLFDSRRVTKCHGSVRTFVDTLTDETTTTSPHFRKITADDFCTFQLNLEPGSLLVNVSINSLAQTKYTQEVSVSGSRGTVTWSGQRVVFKSTNKLTVSKINEQLDKNNNNTLDSLSANLSGYYELDMLNSDNTPSTTSKSEEIFLNSYKNLEEKHPELPLIFIKGLFYYLDHVKKEFLTRSGIKPTSTTELENFEHTRLVQLIVKSVYQSSAEGRWVSIGKL